MSRSTLPLHTWWDLHLIFLFAYDGEVSGFGPGVQNIAAATAWLVRAGRASVTMMDDGQTVSAGPGEWLMVRPGLRRQEFEPGTRLLSVNFIAGFLLGEPLFRKGLSRVVPAAAHPVLERRALRLIEVASRSLRNTPDRVHSTHQVGLPAYLRLKAALVDWVAAWGTVLLRQGLTPGDARVEDPRVRAALDLLRRKVGDPDFDSGRLAAEVGLSVSQLNRLFLRERAQTVRQCHQHQRTEYAHTLLMRHDLSLKEVAMELGFKHQSNFTAWFRKLHRMTPTEFRELDPKKTLFTRPKPE